VARALDSDPEQLDLACLPLLRYSEAFGAYRRGRKSELKAWEGSAMMAQVQENDFAAAAEALGHEV